MQEWTSNKLSTVTTKIGSGATPKGGKNAYKTEGVSLIRSMNVHDSVFKEKNLAFIDDAQAEKLSNVIIEENDVLLNITGASIARCCIVPKDVLPARVNQHVSILRPKNEIIESRFLVYLLISNQYKTELLVSGNKAGATREALTKTQLQNFEILHPSIPEQKRIVAILDQAFADIEQARAKTEQNLLNARELFESYLQQVFSQCGEGWEVKPLESLSTIVNGYSFKSGDFSPENGVKSIKITNVGVSEFIEDSNNYLPEEFLGNYSNYTARQGDIVVALTRTIISTGLKVAVVPESYHKALINQRVAAVKVNEEIISREVLQAFLSTKDAINYVKRNVNELMQPNLSIKDLKAFPVPVPPKNETMEITHKIKTLQLHAENLSDVYQNKLLALDELKKSILHLAFTGQLTLYLEPAEDKGAAA